MVLTEDEFRLLAYIRAYADRREQSLDPDWVQEQLEFSLTQILTASRRLAELGLAEFHEFEGLPCDIRLTEQGWDYLRR